MNPYGRGYYDDGRRRYRTPEYCGCNYEQGNPYYENPYCCDQGNYYGLDCCDTRPRYGQAIAIALVLFILLVIIIH